MIQSWCVNVNNLLLKWSIIYCFSKQFWSIITSWQSIFPLSSSVFQIWTCKCLMIVGCPTTKIISSFSFTIVKWFLASYLWVPSYFFSSEYRSQRFFLLIFQHFPFFKLLLIVLLDFRRISYVWIFFDGSLNILVFVK